jgi:adenosylhomocysteinase
MKDGAMLANSGHFNVELDLAALEKIAKTVNRAIKESVDEYILQDGRRIYVLGEGRLINLAAAHGHPASVMDMSFATQALTSEWCVKSAGKLTARVYDVPREVEEFVGTLKLKTMGIQIDHLTAEQAKYLQSWEMGT